MARTRKPLLLTLLWTAAVASSLLADEVRRTDGSVVIGRARVDGDVVRVVTESGTVVLPRSDVVRIRSDAELLDELDRLAQMAGDRPYAWLDIARRARQWRLDDRMWRDLDRCLLLSTATSDRARLDAFLAELEPALLPAHRLRASDATQVRELLYLVRPEVPAAKVAAVEAVLASFQSDEAASALRARARDASSDLQRIVALSAIERRGGQEAERFVWRAAILDSSRDIRASVAQHVVADGARDEAVDYLATGLASEDPGRRIRTAEALADLGGDAAIGHLVAAGPAVPAAAEGLPGGSTRAYAAFVNQQAYIRDFNVEVAQASFIADPVVDVVQSGTVLDVTVHAVATYRTYILGAYRAALQRLTGDDPGPNPETWAAWLAARRAEAPAAPAKAPTTPH